MASYNGQDFSAMQQEAMVRLREMHSRSKSLTNQPPTEHQPKPLPPVPKRTPDIFSQILGDGVKLDSEKIIILLMLFVLYKNKADIKLLLALGYLLI